MSQDTGPVRVLEEDGGTLLRLVLARPKGNILNREMVAALRDAVALSGRNPRARTLLFEGEGRHFSFGASVEEHRAGEVETMLPGFHGLFRDLAASGKVLLAAVRGQCLGGGLELAAFCHRIFATPDARLGNPEISLGVFAPLASMVLPLRVGQARADDLLLTGRSVDAQEALAMGLVDALAEDPADAALSYHRQYLLPLSASSLAHAVKAARCRYHKELEETLVTLERQYLEGLMATADAHEGIAAFLEKRSPEWRHSMQKTSENSGSSR